MRIIAVWSESGGVGKSTMAWFIASGLAEIGHDVLLLDTDRQRMCVRHAAAAKAHGIVHPFDVVTPDDEARDAGVLVVDCGGGDDSWLERADVVVLPTRPTRHGVDVAQSFRSLIPATARCIDVAIVDRRHPVHKALEPELVKRGFQIVRLRSLATELCDVGATPFRHALPASRRSSLSELRADFIPIITEAAKS